MSRQLTFSVAVCALTMALFAMVAGLGPIGGSAADQPLVLAAHLG